MGRMVDDLKEYRRTQEEILARYESLSATFTDRTDSSLKEKVARCIATVKKHLEDIDKDIARYEQEEKENRYHCFGSRAGIGREKIEVIGPRAELLELAECILLDGAMSESWTGLAQEIKWTLERSDNA